MNYQNVFMLIYDVVAVVFMRGQFKKSPIKKVTSKKRLSCYFCSNYCRETSDFDVPGVGGYGTRCSAYRNVLATRFGS